MRAVSTDNRMRAWCADDSLEDGLLFKCYLGRVDLEAPVGKPSVSHISIKHTTHALHAHYPCSCRLPNALGIWPLHFGRILNSCSAGPTRYALLASRTSIRYCTCGPQAYLHEVQNHHPCGPGIARKLHTYHLSFRHIHSSSMLSTCRLQWLDSNVLHAVCVQCGQNTCSNGCVMIPCHLLIAFPRLSDRLVAAIHRCHQNGELL